MRTLIDVLRARVISVFSTSGCPSSAGFAIIVLLLARTAAISQSPAPQPGTPAAVQSPAPATAPAPTQANPPSAASVDTHGSTNISGTHEVADNPTLSAGPFSIQTTGGEIKEDQLKQMLVGKTLYLRAGYQDNNLEFDEHGRIVSHSPQGSFTLSQIQINKVKLSKHKLELEGDRYALHFLGAAPYEDPTKATDRVKITPKKKTVRISLVREQVEIPKKKKEHKKDQDQLAKAGAKNRAKAAVAVDAVNSDPQATEPDRKKEATTTSQVHASQLLLTSLDRVFSQGIDDRMVAAMPDFWKLYYQAAQAKADIKPVGDGVYTENTVDQKAKLISALAPPSNEFAQANGVAGVAMYHALVGSDGKVEAVVAGRPIGFGLDESAEQTIRKATFQPAMKGGKPVPVALDLVVSFRIYSKRTSEPAPQDASEEKPKPELPGPYTLQAEEAAHDAQQNQTTQAPQSAPPAEAQPAQSAQPQPARTSPRAPTPQ